MTGKLILRSAHVLKTKTGARNVPSPIVCAGGDAQKRFLEFFAARIRNKNTREPYVRAVLDFLDWAEEAAGISDLGDIEPVHVGRLGGAQEPGVRATNGQATARVATPPV